MALGLKIAPGLVERAVGHAGPPLQFKAAPHAETSGNIFAAIPGEHAVSGGWRKEWLRILFGVRR